MALPTRIPRPNLWAVFLSDLHVGMTKKHKTKTISCSKAAQKLFGTPEFMSRLHGKTWNGEYDACVGEALPEIRRVHFPSFDDVPKHVIKKTHDVVTPSCFQN